MAPSTRFAVAFLGAFSLSCLLTRLLIGCSARWRFIAEPRADRWHRSPVPDTGGVAIVLSLVACWCFARWQPAMVLCAVLSAVLGFVDDRVRLRPAAKLAGQSVVAIAAIACGAVFPIAPWGWLNACVTFLWIVGVANAFNLIDNIDGLCGGVAALAAAAEFIRALQSGDPVTAQCMAALAGSICGFLVFNVSPARIFMGDCGSMFLGFTLAVSAVSGSRPVPDMPGLVLLCPLLAMLYPIFDTVFVATMRRLAGRPVSSGGRDHTSHRLVAAGLSVPAAVRLLWTLSALCGMASLLVRMNSAVGLSAALLLLSGVVALGAVLAALPGFAPLHPAWALSIQQRVLALLPRGIAQRETLR